MPKPTKHWNWIDNSSLRELQQARQYRAFSAGLGFVCAVMSLVIVPWLMSGRLLQEAPTIGQVLGGLAGLAVLLIGQIRPNVFKGIYESWMTAARWVGKINAKLLMCGVFILVVIPLGLAASVVAKLSGREWPPFHTGKKPVLPRSYEHMKELF